MSGATRDRLRRQRDEARREVAVGKVLDRIRKRALAMGTPGDIAGVVEVTRDALAAVGITPQFTMILIRDASGDRARCFGAWPGEAAFEAGKLSFALARELGATHHVPALGRRRWSVSRITKTKHRSEYRKIRKAFDPLHSAAEAEGWINRFTYPVYLHHFAFRGGWLAVDLPYELSPDELAIGRRIADAFGVAWRRLVELQQKDAQNRELTIQNALKRVRSRALGMQSTDDLPSVPATLLREIAALDFKAWFSAIGLVDADRDLVNQWTAVERADIAQFHKRMGTPCSTKSRQSSSRASSCPRWLESTRLRASSSAPPHVQGSSCTPTNSCRMRKCESGTATWWSSRFGIGRRPITR